MTEMKAQKDESRNSNKILILNHSGNPSAMTNKDMERQCSPFSAAYDS